MMLTVERAPLRRRSPLIVLSIAVTLAIVVWLSWPRQEADPAFDARVAAPAWVDRHPLVLFDEGHMNIHKSAGRYRPFADLIRNDGYAIRPLTTRLTSSSLAGGDVLVIVNALGFRGLMQHVANLMRLEGRVHVGGSAFTDEECAAVGDWVARGGSLLLVADHAPAGESAGRLSQVFGVTMTNWYVEDPGAADPDSDAFLEFTRANGLLLDHPITRGRGDAERLAKVVTFTGQSLTAPPSAIPFLRFSPSALEFPTRKSGWSSRRKALGVAQGLALAHGGGRVVILGEAAVLTCQVARYLGREYHFGMGRAGCDNRQLALNIMHWLSRADGMDEAPAAPP